MARIGKAQRALNRALDHRDRMEALVADQWFRRYALDSAFYFIESLLRTDRFHLFTKDQRRVFDEIVEEMKPYSSFAGYTISELIDIAILCKSDCAYQETETFIDALSTERPTELPLWVIKQLVCICRLREPLPRFSEEFPVANNLGGE
jgi:hypothetical protein